MELIERDEFLAVLHDRFKKTASASGHCCFITGEAGIGKTSLVRTFLKQVEGQCLEYTGACDSLFTPRPLAPLYDLSLQMKGDWSEKINSLSSRAELFTRFLQALSGNTLPVVLVFEDIHWADEATLDFIKFLSRRISRTRCLFILTYRDNEVSQYHPLRNLPGDLQPGVFSLLSLTPLSRAAVQKMALEKGYDGEDVFSISGGNPFYVTEILASYSWGIPDNVRNTILSIYHRQEEPTRKVWQLLSVIPEGMEVSRLARVDPGWQESVEDSLSKKILVIRHNKIFFKHELYRRTIEEHLSPFKRIELNKYLLDIFLADFEQAAEIERIVHYAKNANENALVVQFAPGAARKAASVGAHIEASKLLLTAIEYTDPRDTEKLVRFYEDYAYECYLTNQIKNAIIFLSRALKIRQANQETEQIGNSLRFLSRLWWFEGNRLQAERLGEEAIEVLKDQPASKAKAMAYSNMSQLKMLSDQTPDCLYWGQKALDAAEQAGDEETIAHALNCISTTLMLNDGTTQQGIDMLYQSLEISLKNAYHEHVARAYTNLGSNSVTLRNYAMARKTLEEGIHYCEERDLDSWKAYMTAWKSRLNLETGNWAEAYSLASHLIKNENQSPVVKIGALAVAATLKIRRGETGALPLLTEASARAFETMELQRIVPVMMAMLEYEWVTGEQAVSEASLAQTIDLLTRLGKFSRKSRFYFWLKRTSRTHMLPPELGETDPTSPEKTAGQEARFWEQIGSPYEQALCLSEGSEAEKRKALALVQQLGAAAVYERMKRDMRSSGIRKIPRGLRVSTRNNPAQLTTRELEVLQLLKKGIQNRQIAGQLYISPKTVDHHISSIFFKLDVNTRARAVGEALRMGIIN